MGTVLGLLLLPAAAMAAHPHDSYTQARAIALDDNEIVNSTGATPTSASDAANAEPLTASGAGYCDNGQYSTTDGVDMTHTIWWKVTGDGNPVTVDLRGSAVSDTLVAVYDGVPSAATFVACHDDIRGGSSPDRDSEVLFNTNSGTTYYIQIGCVTGCPSPNQGNIDFVAFSSPPGDFRSEALELRSGQPRAGDTRGATEETSELDDLECNGIDYSRTVWYRYRAPGAGTAVFTAGGTFDTVVAVYRGDTRVGCDDDPSTVRIPVTAGDYFLQVGAIGIAPDADYGSFNARVDFTGDPPPDRDRDGVIDSQDRCPDQDARSRDADRDGCLDPVPDLDNDDDGVNDDIDCDDNNPAISQTDKEILGNSVDEDCVGGPQDFPRLQVRYDWDARWARSTRFRELVFSNVPAGTTVRIRCRGKGCRRKLITRRFTRARKRVDFARSMRRNRPRPRARVEVQLTKQDMIGQVVRFTIRLNKKPRVQRLCLRPGATRATRCG